MATPTTLYEYYTQQGKKLPTWQERQPLFEKHGFGKASEYAGTESQNKLLLGALLNENAPKAPAPITPTIGGVPLQPAGQEKLTLESFGKGTPSPAISDEEFSKFAEASLNYKPPALLPKSEKEIAKESWLAGGFTEAQFETAWAQKQAGWKPSPATPGAGIVTVGLTGVGVPKTTTPKEKVVSSLVGKTPASEIKPPELGGVAPELP